MSIPSSNPSSLDAISDRIADLCDAIAPRLVAVHGPRRSSSTGIIWRPGLVLTAEEALEADEDILITRPDGNQVSTSLVGRDPSTDIALQGWIETTYADVSGLNANDPSITLIRQRDVRTRAVHARWKAPVRHLSDDTHKLMRMVCVRMQGASVTFSRSGSLLGMTQV